MRKRLFVLAIIISAIVWIVSAIHESRMNIAHERNGVPYEIPDATKSAGGIRAQVVRVIDGDTIELASGERLRYIGIDTPEEVDARKPLQCFAKQAAERNNELVEGKTITFYKDISDHDKYGRLLGFVYLSDGTFVNELLVTQGYAFAYPYAPDISKAQRFRNAEALARKNRLGLWSACVVHILRTGREQTNTVQ